MSVNLNGHARPAIGKESDNQESDTKKVRRYKTPQGEDFEITEEDFHKVVEIFEYLKNIRDRAEKSTQRGAFEPQKISHITADSIERKAG